MRFGVWTPLPHTVVPEPRMERALADVGIEERYRELLEPAFEQMAEVIRNQE